MFQEMWVRATVKNVGLRQSTQHGLAEIHTKQAKNKTVCSIVYLYLFILSMLPTPIMQESSD